MARLEFPVQRVGNGVLPAIEDASQKPDVGGLERLLRFQGGSLTRGVCFQDQDGSICSLPKHRRVGSSIGPGGIDQDKLEDLAQVIKLPLYLVRGR